MQDMNTSDPASRLLRRLTPYAKLIGLIASILAAAATILGTVLFGIVNIADPLFAARHHGAPFAEQAQLGFGAVGYILLLAIWIGSGGLQFVGSLPSRYRRSKDTEPARGSLFGTLLLSMPLLFGIAFAVSAKVLPAYVLGFATIGAIFGCAAVATRRYARTHSAGAGWFALRALSASAAYYGVAFVSVGMINGAHRYMPNDIMQNTFALIMWFLFLAGVALGMNSVANRRWATLGLAVMLCALGGIMNQPLPVLHALERFAGG